MEKESSFFRTVKFFTFPIFVLLMGCGTTIADPEAATTMLGYEVLNDTDTVIWAAIKIPRYDPDDEKPLEFKRDEIPPWESWESKGRVELPASYYLEVEADGKVPFTITGSVFRDDEVVDTFSVEGEKSGNDDYRISHFIHGEITESE